MKNGKMNFDLSQAVCLREEGNLGEYLRVCVLRARFCRDQDTEWAYRRAAQHAVFGWTQLGYFPLKPSLRKSGCQLLDVGYVVNALIEGNGEYVPSIISNDGKYPTPLDQAAFVYYSATEPSKQSLMAA